MDQTAERYRICLILPPDNPHAACFREVALLVHCALRTNHIDCEFKINELSRDRVNIIFGYHLLNFKTSLKSYRYIPYQLEQLNADEFPFSTNQEQILQNAMDVWDYSEKNMAFLAKRGIRAKLLIPGYHRNLELILPSAGRDIDVLFYGSILDRRRTILEKLSQACNVSALRGVYSEKRDSYISRSKMILNVHHYSTQIFEAIRISYLLNNRCFIVSEDSLEYCYKGVNLVRVPYDQVVETCIDFLKHPEEMENRRWQNYQEFKQLFPMEQLIRQVIPIPSANGSNPV